MAAIDLGQFSHKILLKLPPEVAHSIGKFGMGYGIFAPGRYEVIDYMGGKPRLLGFELDNLLGLAAGFDKNGYLADHVQGYGFGYVEVGSVTWQGGKGNKKPRLFRLWEAEYRRGNLLNRMGLNGDPAYVVVDRLKRAKNPFAVNIAKTHNPEIIGDKAIQDIKNTYQWVVNELKPRGKIIYAAINISCPNTAEGKTFEDNPESLDELLSAIMECGREMPRLLKLSPTLIEEKARKIVEVADNRVSGYICANTLSMEHPNYGKGGVSGKIVRPNTLRTIEMMRSLTRKLIIGCGGIETGRDMLETETAGARVFQAFNGFVLGPYRGPRFAHRVLKEYYQLKNRQGLMGGQS